jgi:hypothetical protein
MDVRKEMKLLLGVLVFSTNAIGGTWVQTDDYTTTNETVQTVPADIHNIAPPGNPPYYVTHNWVYPMHAKNMIDLASLLQPFGCADNNDFTAYVSVNDQWRKGWKWQPEGCLANDPPALTGFDYHIILSARFNCGGYSNDWGMFGGNAYTSGTVDTTVNMYSTPSSGCSSQNSLNIHASNGLQQGGTWVPSTITFVFNVVPLPGFTIQSGWTQRSNYWNSTSDQGTPASRPYDGFMTNQSGTAVADFCDITMTRLSEIHTTANGNADNAACEIQVDVTRFDIPIR